MNLPIARGVGSPSAAGAKLGRKAAPVARLERRRNSRRVNGIFGESIADGFWRQILFYFQFAHDPYLIIDNGTNSTYRFVYISHTLPDGVIDGKYIKNLIL